MRHHVERMVEGRNRRDGAYGFALRVDFARFAMGCQITGKNLAVIKDRKLAREHENVIGAATFVKRILERNAEFAGDQRRQRILLGID